jgi:hypothetical protein
VALLTSTDMQSDESISKIGVMNAAPVFDNRTKLSEIVEEILAEMLQTHFFLIFDLFESKVFLSSSSNFM